MPKNIRSFLLLLLVITTVNSQSKSNPLPEDVSMAKKLKQKYPKQDIVILEKNTKVDFVYKASTKGLSVRVTETTKYIGISPTSRLQHGEVYDLESDVRSLIVRNRRGKELISDSRAKDEYLQSDDLFHTDYRVKYVNLVLPLQGYIKEVETIKTYEDFKYFTSTYFSDPYPIQKNILTINTPIDLTIDFIEFNFDGYAFAKAEDTSKNTKTTTYTFENLQANAKELDTPGPSYLYPHILYVPRFYGDSEEVVFFKSTDDLYNWYNGLVEKVEVDSSIFKDQVASIIEGKQTDEDKISSVFYWIQDNIRYVAFEDGIAGFKPDSPQNVFKKRYGDCKGMAILTKHMLIEAGYDARLVWIGTDRLAYDYSIPSLAVDNHMICSVFIDGDYIFLDGTEKFNKYGEYAGRIQNKQALIQTDNGYEIKKVPQSSGVSNVKTQEYELNLSGEQLTGNGTKKFRGESRVSFQNSLLSFESNDQETALIHYLAQGSRNIKIDNLELEDMKSRDKEVVVSYDVTIDEAVSSFDSTYYIDLSFMDLQIEELPEDREVDFKIPFKENTAKKLQLTLPDALKLANLPEGLTIDNELLTIAVSFSQIDNTVEVNEQIVFKKNIIKKESFSEWNNAREALANTIGQQLEITSGN